MNDQNVSRFEESYFSVSRFVPEHSENDSWRLAICLFTTTAAVADKALTLKRFQLHYE